MVCMIIAGSFGMSIADSQGIYPEPHRQEESDGVHRCDCHARYCTARPRQPLRPQLYHLYLGFVRFTSSIPSPTRRRAVAGIFPLANVLIHGHKHAPPLLGEVIHLAVIHPRRLCHLSRWGRILRPDGAGSHRVCPQGSLSPPNPSSWL